MDNLVRIDRLESERIAIVQFDAGTGANAMSQALLHQLTEAARSFENDSETNAIILTGGDTVFSMGMDLKDPVFSTARDLPLAERRKLLQAGPRMCRAWEELEPLTICAIEGWCIGGGVALAASLDLRVCGRDSRFYVPEIERGLNMSWGSLPRIANLVGPARTKRLAALAEKIDAPTAENWGFVDHVADKGGVVEIALAVAEQAATMPPVALRMIKQGVDTATKALNATASAMDMDQFALMMGSGDFEEGVRSFLEKRDAKFTGT
jgi:enoyl-CoA hydratase/carnithine racemase